MANLDVIRAFCWAGDDQVKSISAWERRDRKCSILPFFALFLLAFFLLQSCVWEGRQGEIPAGV